MTAQVTINKKEKSELEITGEIPADAFESHRKVAVEYLSERVNIPGFRKGKAPEDVLSRHTGDMAILEEMAERAISESYPKIIVEHNLDVVGDPQVQITKIAKGSPLGFKIIVAVTPEVTLPDYKKIGEKATKEPMSEMTASEDEVEKTIEEIRKLRARTIRADEENAKGKMDAAPKDLPPLTDENVKELGEFENLADLRAKIKENIVAEKTTKEMQKRRAALTEELVKNATAEVPHVLVERELDRLVAQFSSDVSRMGLEFDKYLEHLKKTVAEIRDEWRSQAEKNVKIGLILTKIADVEKIEANPEAIETEVKHIMEHYPGAREERARSYAATILRHEKVFEFLEGKK